jgi:hypothetical protein
MDRVSHEYIVSLLDKYENLDEETKAVLEKEAKLILTNKVIEALMKQPNIVDNMKGIEGYLHHSLHFLNEDERKETIRETLSSITGDKVRDKKDSFIEAAPLVGDDHGGDEYAESNSGEKNPAKSEEDLLFPKKRHSKNPIKESGKKT